MYYVVPLERVRLSVTANLNGLHLIFFFMIVLMIVAWKIEWMVKCERDDSLQQNGHHLQTCRNLFFQSIRNGYHCIIFAQLTFEFVSLSLLSVYPFFSLKFWRQKTPFVVVCNIKSSSATWCNWIQFFIFLIFSRTSSSSSIYISRILLSRFL